MVKEKQAIEELNFFELHFSCSNDLLDAIYRTNPTPQSEEEYDEVVSSYRQYFFLANMLVDSIPASMNDSMRETIYQFSLLLMEWFQLSAERMTHLKGKATATERYTFLDDRKYRKRLNQIEKELPIIGESINKYKLNLQEQVNG